jgi:hypothetical protein
MATTNGTDGTKRALSSLGELSRDVAPRRDLWPAIAQEIEKEIGDSGAGAERLGRRSRWRPAGGHWVAAAAVIVALVVGMWVGRDVLPGAGGTPPVNVAVNGANAGTAANPANGAQQVLASSFVTDPRYVKERDAMIKVLEAQLDSLPPQTQQKVESSLKTIRGSMKDIQAALGRDPANALLQELLVNTYQDEMRVLTAVHEASDAGRGI